MSQPFNPNPRCNCIHPESAHDPETGACLATNPVHGPCPCAATPESVRAELEADFRAHPADATQLRALYHE